MIERARARDRQAAEALVTHYATLVRHLVLRFLGPRRGTDLDDVQQEVFIRIIEALPSYTGNGALSSWVAAITVNTVRQTLRKESVRRGSVSTDSSAMAEFMDLQAGSERTLAAKEMLVEVYRALDSLSPTHRMAVVLKISGHSIEEIAAMMNSARSTTRLRLYYGRKAFAKALAAGKFKKEETQ
jgi:RNA polymerase sigma-70 factor, ECF subfamily